MREVPLDAGQQEMHAMTQAAVQKRKTDTDRSRDRARTEETILAAARLVLAEQGFQGFGINAVARAAGCDKQLIYRYFDGLDGLVAAIGDELARRIGDSLAGSDAEASPRSYAELMERLMLRFIDALRGDVLVQKIVAWEISSDSPEVRSLAEARSVALSRWIGSQRGALLPPEGIDAPATNALLIAAAQHLVLSAHATGAFAGVPLVSDADWDRLRAAIRRLVQLAYRPS
jgi:AcrR family transcriptional regulator